MHANQFGGHGLSGFGDFVPFCLPSKWPKFPFQTMGVKKFMQVEVDVICMQTNFGGCGHSSIRDFAPF